MCERYTLFHTKKLHEFFSVEGDASKARAPQYNISPTQLAPVVVNRDGENYLLDMKWGFIPAGAKDANSVFRYKTHMVKSETIFDKPAYETAVRKNRCLIPCTGYYVWDDEKQPYFVRPKDQELFALAGICSSWTDPSGKQWGTFTVVTTIANNQLDQITNRMPVMVAHEMMSRWLDADVVDATALYDMMRPYPADMLTVHAVSDAVNSKKVNDPKLIRAL